MIGSLVNFHQHKIWGKPLLPQFMCTKRDKEQDLSIHKVLNKDVLRDYSHYAGILNHQENIRCKLSIQSLSFTGKHIILPVRKFSSSGLRAPPVA
jgi:hypothetical protein